jgi:aquaporin Z
MTRKLVVEAIGTFFLVLTVGMVVLGRGAGALAPLAIGFVLMVMVYAGGHVSGGHYNPAVTLGVRLRGLATNAELFGYWIAQVLAGVLAAFVATALLPDGVQVVPGEHELLDVVVAAFLFTFALVWVVLNVATAPGTRGNSYFGLAIGLTLTVAAYAIGPVSGAILNPAVAVGATLLGILDVGEAAAMIVTQLLAGAFALFAFDWLDIGQDKPTTAPPAEQRSLRDAAEPGA